MDLPRSSIAAVLLHRDELRLSDAQVDALLRRDEALAKEDEPLRARRALDGGVRPTANPPGSPRPGRHRDPHRAAPVPRADDVLTLLDDNDTRAYLEVDEHVLTEEQRPRAREIASAYREALYDVQHPRPKAAADSAARAAALQDAGSR